jgi:transcription elongation factor Elf1
MSDRQRTRFDAIAEEMAEEPRMMTPETANVIVGSTKFTCPTCKLDAFEVLEKHKDADQVVVCLGCPTNPSYELSTSDGVAVCIGMRGYRCGRCGHNPLVTATLSEVNLYCRRCAQLTLHARVTTTKDCPPQVESAVPKIQPSGRKLTREARAKFDELVKTYSTSNLEATALYPLLRTPAGRDSKRRAMNVDATVEAMRRTIGLDDFEEFRAKARKRNADLAVLSGEDLDLKRGSGRTTRGLLAALAACLARETEVLWVCGHRSLYDANLRQLCWDLTAQLRLAHPIDVRRMPGELRVIKYGSRSGNHHLYVDHSFYESRNERRLDIGMLNGIVDAQERS